MQITLRLVAAFTFMTLCVNAQQKGSQATSGIEGIWEFKGTRSQSNTEFRRPPTTILKILSTDGTINNVVISPKGSVISARGTYTVESDSTYTEHILATPNNLAIEGKTVRLFYKIKDNKQMYLRFFLEKNARGNAAPTTYEELWVRVEVPKVK